MNVIADVGGNYCAGQVLKFDFLVKLNVKIITIVEVLDAEGIHFVLKTNSETVSTFPRVQFRELVQCNVSASCRLVTALFDKILVVFITADNFCVGTSEIRRTSRLIANLPSAFLRSAITLADGFLFVAKLIPDQSRVYQGHLVLALIRALFAGDTS